MYEVIEKYSPIAVSESHYGNIKVHFIRMPFVFEEDVGNTKRKLVEVVKGIF
jgi:hypothetical protein